MEMVLDGMAAADCKNTELEEKDKWAMKTAMFFIVFLVLFWRYCDVSENSEPNYSNFFHSERSCYFLANYYIL